MLIDFYRNLLEKLGLFIRKIQKPKPFKWKRKISSRLVQGAIKEGRE